MTENRYIEQRKRCTGELVMSIYTGKGGALLDRLARAVVWQTEFAELRGAEKVSVPTLRAVVFGHAKRQLRRLWDAAGTPSGLGVRVGLSMRAGSPILPKYSRARLTFFDVCLMRELRENGALLRELGWWFGVSPNYACAICTGDVWRTAPISPRGYIQSIQGTA